MRIGDWEPCRGVFVIAEIGPNHNGCLDTARSLIRAAAAAGADAVKFQRYAAERLVHGGLLTMAHVRGTHRTQRERMKSLEFTQDEWRELAGLAGACGVAFLASAFDEGSADALEELVPAFKVASGDLTHLPLIRHVAGKGKPVIISTGMASVAEIDTALALVPRERVALLHCVSRYPTPPGASNLRSIPFLADRFGMPVGYSDHTVGTRACFAAVALGAVVIEKHFTLDKTQTPGDHPLSAEPDELADLVTGVREIEPMLGVHDKVPDEAELGMRQAMRRSIYARRDLAAGTRLTADDLVIMRPETGLSPSRLDDLLGRVVTRDVRAESLIEEGDW